MLHEPNVFVVDDDAGMRESLRWLAESAGLNVRTYARAADFLADYDVSCPGCLVADLRMPGMSGLELQQELLARAARIPLIIVTAYANARIAVQAMKDGAFDFIEKPFTNERILDRIRDAIAADQHARQTRAAQASTVRQLAGLTRREREVLERVVAGKTSAAIAVELGLKTGTVSFHRARLYEKLGVRSVAALVRMCAATAKGTT